MKLDRTRRFYLIYSDLSLTQLGYWFGRRPMSHIIFHPENYDRHPHDPKTDQMRMIEWLLIKEHTEEELNGGSNVLKDAHHGQRNLFCSRGKHKQWNTGDNSRGCQEQVYLCAIMQESSAAVHL